MQDLVYVTNEGSSSLGEDKASDSVKVDGTAEEMEGRFA